MNSSTYDTSELVERNNELLGDNELLREQIAGLESDLKEERRRLDAVDLELEEIDKQVVHARQRLKQKEDPWLRGYASGKERTASNIRHALSDSSAKPSNYAKAGRILDDAASEAQRRSRV